MNRVLTRYFLCDHDIIFNIFSHNEYNETLAIQLNDAPNTQQKKKKSVEIRKLH